MLELLTTILVVPSVLALLAIVFATEGFTGRVPGGPDAMALAMPFLMAIAAGIALVVATWLCAAAGGLDWLTRSRALAALLATLLSLGVATAAVAVLVAWMERLGSWVPFAGFVCGGIAPAALGVLLIACAWASAPALAASPLPRAVAIGLAVPALLGYALAARGLIAHARKKAARNRERIAELRAREV